MMQFKACPRCKGDLEFERNEVGDVEAYCLQCGLRRFGRVSDFQTPEVLRVAPDRRGSLARITKPRVPGDRRTRRGGVHRRVLTAV